MALHHDSDLPPLTEASGEKALLLKCLFSYVAAKDPRAIEAIGESIKVKDSVAQTRGFLRLNASDNALSFGLHYLREPILAYIKEKTIALPPEIRALQTAIVERDAEQLEMPFFVNAAGVSEYAGAKVNRWDAFARAYVGAWHIYRFSSDDQKPRVVNRGFLNIKPRSKEQLASGEPPLFSMYFREGRNRILTAALRRDLINKPSARLGRQMLAVGKATGTVFPLAERVTFMGARVAQSNQHLVSMIWPISQVALDNGEVVESSFGIALIPNAAGEHVASYVYAKRFKGSENWTAKDYEDHKQKETSAVAYAQFDIEVEAELAELKSEIGDLALEMLDGLHSESSGVLTIG